MTNIIFVDTSPYEVSQAVVGALVVALLVGLFGIAKRSPTTYRRLYPKLFTFALVPAPLMVIVQPEIFYTDWLILWGVTLVGLTVIYALRHALAVIDDPE